MCSISGAILLDQDRTQDEYDKIRDKIHDIIVQAEDRGRDSTGVISFTRDGEAREFKALGKPSEVLDKSNVVVDEDTTVVINNNRAEPTTEYVEDKADTDIQPFTDGRFWVAHNGTIANDLEIKEDLNLNPSTEIDTAILPCMFSKLEEVYEPLKLDVEGSFGLSIFDQEDPERLRLATNYKPLTMMYDRELGVIYFSSLERYLIEDNYIMENRKVEEIDPYTYVELNTNDGVVNRKSIKQDQDESVLVICSGGLDSTTTAKYMIEQGYDVTLIHFKYDCRAQEKEVEAVKEVAERLDVPLIMMDTGFFKTDIGNSRLTDTAEDLVDERSGEASAELAWEWVPARNLIMLSIATGIAEVQGISKIALGNNLEESGAYPDNEMVFIEKVNEALPWATNVDSHVEIIEPVGNLMKHEIVKLGLDIDAPLDITWSCYNAGEKHCGECGPCYMRKHAFDMAGKDEVIEYDNPELRKKGGGGD